MPKASISATKPDLPTRTIKFEIDRTTKNTTRYVEVTDEAPVIGTLYVKGWFAKGYTRALVVLTMLPDEED